MTKKMYLERLERNLSQLSKEEIKEILEDVNEHFVSGIAGSRTEDDISQGLGSPKELAFNLLSQYDVKSNRKFKIVDSILTWFSFISIGFSNIILLPLFFSIAALVGSLFVCIGAFLVSGLLLIVAPILERVAPSIVSSGNIPIAVLPIIGIFIVFGTLKLNKYMVIGSKKLYKYALQFSKSQLFVLNFFKTDRKSV